MIPAKWWILLCWYLEKDTNEPFEQNALDELVADGFIDEVTAELTQRGRDAILKLEVLGDPKDVTKPVGDPSGV